MNGIRTKLKLLYLSPNKHRFELLYIGLVRISTTFVEFFIRAELDLHSGMLKEQFSPLAI